MTRRATLESEIQRQIEADLGAEPDFLILRNSVGLATFFKDDGGSWKVPFGLGTGSPDLVGMLAPRARWVCMEVKCPGEVAEPHQEKCHAQWRAFGALVYVVTSPDEARAALNDARAQK